MIQFIPWLMAAGSAAAGAGSLMPNKQHVQTQAPVGGGQTGMNPMGEFLLSQEQQGPPVPGGVGQTPPSTMPDAPTPATTDSSQQGDQKSKDRLSEIGDILQSIPEALAIAAPLLGLNTGDERKIPAPGGGGSNPMNPYASAFGPLPKPPTLGELIAGLPRMR